MDQGAQGLGEKEVKSGWACFGSPLDKDRATKAHGNNVELLQRNRNLEQF